MRISARQWQDLVGCDDHSLSTVGYCAGARRRNGRSEVGAMTDAGEYADRVNVLIVTFDADVQAAIENRQQHLHPEFNFNEWNSFINDTMWETSPPHGWRVYYDDLDIIDFTLHKAGTMRNIGIFESRFVEFRESFIRSGGKTDVPVPDHPGIFETPQEAEQRKESEPAYVKWALVIAAVGVVGYTLTGVARLKGS